MANLRHCGFPFCPLFFYLLVILGLGAFYQVSTFPIQHPNTFKQPGTLELKSLFYKWSFLEQNPLLQFYHHKTCIDGYYFGSADH